MTTATQPAPKIPAHGTQYRYKGPHNGAWQPCRCTTCVRAHTRAGTLRALAHLNGTPPLHPAGPVLEHIALLNASGMKNDLIARRAGVAASTLSYLTRGLTKSLRRENALKILAVLPGDFDDTAYKPALGSVRRVRALYAIGHNHTTIAAIAGLDQSMVSHIANDYYQQLSGRVARAIAYTYQQLKFTPGTSRRAVQVARAADWASPLGWDGNIDDPAAIPDSGGSDELAPKRDGHRNREIRHLAGYGITPAEIARRVGLNEQDVSDRLKKWAKEDRDRRRQAAS